MKNHSDMVSTSKQGSVDIIYFYLFEARGDETDVQVRLLERDAREREPSFLEKQIAQLEAKEILESRTTWETQRTNENNLYSVGSFPFEILLCKGGLELYV